MPGQDDHSSGPRILPAAELNPLLNPLLGENMGRWAEVYFTSPPEKREQAVLELLRELEAKRSRHEEGESIRASDLALAQTSVKPVTHTRCEACGGENPVSHKYCGLCGAGLGEARAYSIFGDGDSHRAAEGYSVEEESPETSGRDRGEDRRETQYDEEIRNYAYPEPQEIRHHANGNGLSLFQSVGDSGSDGRIEWSDELEPSPPYRYYIGAALAVIMVVLGYMAWRGTQGSPNSHEVSALPPAAASDTAPASIPAPAPEKGVAEPSGQVAASASAPVSGVSADTSASADVPKNPVETKSSRNQLAQTRGAQVRNVATAPAAAVPPPTPGAQPAIPAAQSAGNGGEELAIAERYLTGATGQRPDTTEAAKWLWKSVAKHNGQATILLSDLYLKGSGVPKNCDQARVLLDSAARKGIAGAGERLRNLPAFGCE